MNKVTVEQVVLDKKYSHVKIYKVSKNEKDIFVGKIKNNGISNIIVPYYSLKAFHITFLAKPKNDKYEIIEAYAFIPKYEKEKYKRSFNKLLTRAITKFDLLTAEGYNSTKDYSLVFMDSLHKYVNDILKERKNEKSN